MSLFDRVPSPSIAPPRWPGLLASVGGETAVREFMRANPSSGGGARWERGFSFAPNDCDFNDELPLDACSGSAFDLDSSDPDLDASVDVAPLYYWETARCSTLTNDPNEVTRRATSRLDRSLSHKLEREFWTGEGHTALGLSAQYLTDAAATTELNAGAATPLVYALADLQSAWAECSLGRRAMIHATVRTTTLWLSAGVVRREGGLLLDVFDNVVVPGTGYDGSAPGGAVDATGDTAWAYVTPVVNLRLGEAVVVEGAPTRVDIPNNVDLALAFRAGVVYYDPCCVYGVNIDHVNTCGTPTGS